MQREFSTPFRQAGAVRAERRLLAAALAHGSAPYLILRFVVVQGRFDVAHQRVHEPLRLSHLLAGLVVHRAQISARAGEKSEAANSWGTALIRKGAEEERRA